MAAGHPGTMKTPLTFALPKAGEEGGLGLLHGTIIAVVYLCLVLQNFVKDEICLKEVTWEG